MATGTLAAAVSVNSRSPVNASNGKAPTASDGDYLAANAGSAYLAVYNPENDTVDLTFTIPSNVNIDGQTVTSKTATVAPYKTVLVGPFPVAWYNDLNGRVKITAAMAAAGVLANVRVKALRLGA